MKLFTVWLKMAAHGGLVKVEHDMKHATDPSQEIF